MRKIKAFFSIMAAIIIFATCAHTEVYAATQWTFYVYGHMFGRYYGDGSGAYNSIATRRINLSREELVGQNFSFDSLGLSMHLSDGTAIVDEVVKNQLNGKKYQCVGFVPFDGNYPRTSNIANADWAYENYGKFNTLEEAKAFVSNQNGILYNEVATEENIKSIEALSRKNAKKTIQYNNVICVWFVSENKSPLSEMTHYSYDNVEFSGIKPIDYKPTTENVDIVAETYGSNITFTITINPEVDTDVINLNLAELITDKINIQPGDTVTYTVNVVDKTSKKYSYIPGSGKIGTEPLNGDGTLGVGFEGYRIPNPSTIGSDMGTLVSFVPYRTNNIAIQTLLAESDRHGELSDESIGKALHNIGYGKDSENNTIPIFINSDGSIAYENITAAYLSDFYLDYFNFKSKTNPENQSQMFTSFSDLLKDDLIDTLIMGDAHTLTPETNAEVANALYYIVYGRAVYANNNTIYYWMDGHEDEFDRQLMQTFQKSEDGHFSMNFNLKLDGQLVNNAFQNMRLGVGMQFQLQAGGEERSSQIDPDGESSNQSIAKTNDTKDFDVITTSALICLSAFFMLYFSKNIKKHDSDKI